MRHALYAIKQAEEWVNNLVTVSEGITSSLFQKECDDVERFVVTAGGSVSKAKLVNRFRAMRFREFNERLESLYQQGRLREDPSGTKVEVNI
jgi:signal transduction histidine kinase